MCVFLITCWILNVADLELKFELCFFYMAFDSVVQTDGAEVFSLQKKVFQKYWLGSSLWFSFQLNRTNNFRVENLISMFKHVNSVFLKSRIAVLIERNVPKLVPNKRKKIVQTLALEALVLFLILAPFCSSFLLSQTSPPCQRWPRSKLFQQTKNNNKNQHLFEVLSFLSPPSLKQVRKPKLQTFCGCVCVQENNTFRV